MVREKRRRYEGWGSRVGCGGAFYRGPRWTSACGTRPREGVRGADSTQSPLRIVARAGAQMPGLVGARAGGAAGARVARKQGEAHGQRRSSARGQIGLGLNRVPAGHGEEGDPDRRGPPVGGREGRGRERRVVPGKRKWAGGGVLGLGEKGKKGDGPVGLKSRGGKRKGFAFLKLIQTIQFKLKFRKFKFEPNNK